MQKKILIYLLSSAFIANQIWLIKANECALNTECKHIRDCPSILNNFHWIRHKPYCNLDQRGTFVCCLKPAEKYTQNKDEDIRIVQECKSYQSLRTSCTKNLIVGGDEADPKEFPFMALLIYKTKDVFRAMCGGTLISKTFVLSAAHCFYHSNPPNTVRLGELDVSVTTEEADPVDFALKNIFIHPQYYTTYVQEKYNDIALVELDKEVVYNDFIMPACLPLVDGREFDNYMATGWGYPNDTTTKGTNRLNKVKLDRIDDDTCFKKLGQTDVLNDGVNNRTQMCAGSLKHKRDTCRGDSGGPLFVDHPDYDCLFLVVGITSFAQGGCGNIGHPAVYTRIQLYLDWIEQIVWKEAVKWS